MSMPKIVGAALFVLALVIEPHHASAQAPAQSFADLRPLIKTGQKIVVVDNEGKRITGDLVSVTGSQLEIWRLRWRRWFRLQREQLTFSESAVRRIMNNDSDADGMLIGLGIGAAVTLLLSDKCGENAIACDYVTILSPVGGLVIGSTIDGAIKRTLYEAPGGSRVTMVPLIRRDRVALAAAIRF